jgi:hypothetical protein
MLKELSLQFRSCNVIYRERERGVRKKGCQEECADIIEKLIVALVFNKFSAFI